MTDIVVKHFAYQARLIVRSEDEAAARAVLGEDDE